MPKYLRSCDVIEFVVLCLIEEWRQNVALSFHCCALDFFLLQSTAFPSEVKDLTKKIHTVLQATAQMKVWWWLSLVPFVGLVIITIEERSKVHFTLCNTHAHPSLIFHPAFIAFSSNLLIPWKISCLKNPQVCHGGPNKEAFRKLSLKCYCMISLKSSVFQKSISQNSPSVIERDRSVCGVIYFCNGCYSQ